MEVCPHILRGNSKSQNNGDTFDWKKKKANPPEKKQKEEYIIYTNLSMDSYFVFLMEDYSFGRGD